ncbi:hypothetical protein [Hyalangium versicolor]|uniref:hypothetical protein n=1 Tax=Hyalangium versicolor TaxID=2861190 RepID=UPI001CCCCD80|nr:hypothetical protein [Hyalangium versicolor]
MSIKNLLSAIRAPQRASVTPANPQPASPAPTPGVQPSAPRASANQFESARSQQVAGVNGGLFPTVGGLKPLAQGQTVAEVNLSDGYTTCLENAYRTAKPGDKVVFLEDLKDNSEHVVVVHPGQTLKEAGADPMRYRLIGTPLDASQLRGVIEAPANQRAGKLAAALGVDVASVATKKWADPSTDPRIPVFQQNATQAAATATAMQPEAAAIWLLTGNGIDQALGQASVTGNAVKDQVLFGLYATSNNQGGFFPPTHDGTLDMWADQITQGADFTTYLTSKTMEHFSNIPTGAAGFHPMVNDSQWPGSNNQVGHFFTAIHMGMLREGATGSQRFLLDAAAYGHELIGDSATAMAQLNAGAGALLGQQVDVSTGQIPSEFRPQNNFFDNAVSWALSTNGQPLTSRELAEIDASARLLMPGVQDGQAIPGRDGNSLEDMRLTLVGVAFGQLVSRGAFATPADAQRWLESAIGPNAQWPSAPPGSVMA